MQISQHFTFPPMTSNQMADGPSSLDVGCNEARYVPALSVGASYIGRWRSPGESVEQTTWDRMERQTSKATDVAESVSHLDMANCMGVLVLCRGVERKYRSCKIPTSVLTLL